MSVDQRQQAFISPAKVEVSTPVINGNYCSLTKIMAITKAKKKEVVASFNDMLKDAQSTVFVQFTNLLVKDANALRRALRAEGISYKVGKKTLLKRVLTEMNLNGELPALVGQIAVASSNTDALAPARVIYEFQKSNPKVVSIVGGIFEGSFKDQGRMVEIASIPSREVLLSQIAYLLKSPMQRLAIAVNEVAKQK